MAETAKDKVVGIRNSSNGPVKNINSETSELSNAGTLQSNDSVSNMTLSDGDSGNDADDEYSSEGYYDFEDSSDEEYVDRELDRLEKERVRDEVPYSEKKGEPVPTFVPLMLKLRNYTSIFSTDDEFYSTDCYDDYDEQGRAKYNPTPSEWARMETMAAESLRKLPPKEPFEGDWAENWHPEKQPFIPSRYTEEQLKAMRTFPAKPRSKHYRPSTWTTCRDVVEKKPKPEETKEDL